VGSYELDKEPSCYVESGGFLEQLGNYLLLKKTLLYGVNLFICFRFEYICFAPHQDATGSRIVQRPPRNISFKTRLGESSRSLKANCRTGRNLSARNTITVKQ
jgi:hypothetical protein